ncbi:MFS transporter [Pseudonocardia hierapolitana]|uniref:MFS transporter n=1 Tax=Pseudonocardia hierapolitana TaxID=1128676 RepID=A0A561SHS5_9PSEU|nr:MFS transporter [Pseudonocardia hierapolitana]
MTSAGLLTLLLGAALNVIDFFIVNVALPTIDADLEASSATLEMVVAGYGIAFAVLLVLGGRLGDAFGRRRMFRIGLSAFTVTSLVCGLAPNATTLVLARIAQGAAAAIAMPQVLASIQALTSGDERARAVGYYGANSGISMVVGQVLGGALVAADVAGLGWRTIFLVNVPIGIVTLVLARRAVPESRSANPLGVDGRGTVLLAATLLALLVPLTEGRALGWPAWSVALLAAVPVLGLWLAVVERRVERAGRVPLLPPSVLRLPSMRRGLGVAAPFFVGFGGFMFICALLLQDGLRMGPLGAGFALAPLAVGFFAASMANARLVARFGRSVVVAGFALQLLGLLVVLATVSAGWPDLTALDIAPGTLICGVGQGMAMTTVIGLTLAQVPADRAGAGSGVFSTAQQTFLALGVATLGGLYAELADVIGPRDGFVVVVCLHVLLTVGIVLLSRRLPDPRVRSGSA